MPKLSDLLKSNEAAQKLLEEQQHESKPEPKKGIKTKGEKKKPAKTVSVKVVAGNLGLTEAQTKRLMLYHELDSKNKHSRKPGKKLTMEEVEKLKILYAIHKRKGELKEILDSATSLPENSLRIDSSKNVSGKKQNKPKKTPQFVKPVRLAKLAQTVQKSIRQITDLLEEGGMAIEGPYQKLSADLANAIVEYFVQRSGKLTVFQHLPKPIIPEPPPGFLTENPYQEYIQELIENKSPFSEVRETLYWGLENSLDTHFTDFQAFSLCQGLKDGRPRKLARLFFANQISKEERYEAHQWAMATLSKYGAERVHFMLSLPPLPFKALDSRAIFSELDKRAEHTNTPIIRLLLKEPYAGNHSLSISFHAESQQAPDRDIIQVRKKGQNGVLLRLSRSGHILPGSKPKAIIPVAQFFVRISDDMQKAIVYYGQHSGECAICGRPLTDPESIKNGIGPVCALNQGF